MVVLTDGHDNYPDPAVFDRLCRFVKTPPVAGFHMDIVAIGSDVDMPRLMRLFESNPKKISIVPGNDDAAGIKAAFTVVQKKMETRLRAMEVQIGVSARMTDGGSMPANMPHLNRTFAGLGFNPGFGGVRLLPAGSRGHGQ